MLSIDQAITQLLNQAQGITETETISLQQALGRVIAADILSTIDVPPADNSAMDGYAVDTNDLDKTQEHSVLTISQTVAAGHAPSPLIEGTAARIFTGAEIPSGANAVVMQEKCTVEDTLVHIPSNITPNNNIRARGQDIIKGDCILKEGKKLQPQDIGLLASIGINKVTVYRQLRVAILSTGDELIEPGQPLTPGKIYNSNRYLLYSFLQQLGMEVVDIGVIADTLESTTDGLQRAAKQADCIISTGGVSVGDEDYIKKAVLQLGRLDFWRIAIKPGKPLAFGTIDTEEKTTPFIGLPGNPASVFITFLIFARPFLLACQQQRFRSLQTRPVIANFSWKENPIRQEYLRGRIIDTDKVDIYPNQSSGVLSSTSWAEGLVIVPPKTMIKTGDQVEFVPFSELL